MLVAILVIRIRLLLVAMLMLAAFVPAMPVSLTHAQDEEWQEDTGEASEEELYHEEEPTYDDAAPQDDGSTEEPAVDDLSWLPNTPYEPLDFSPFEEGLAKISPERMLELQAMIVEADVQQLQGLLEARKLTSQELVLFYVDRIRTYDAGQLNSVSQLNPDALYLAHLADVQRANGEVKGILQGIPVLLKENIATGDSMATTAGALALADSLAVHDAYLVQQLRDAGAVILGKTNMTEWANWMHMSIANGYSAFGGQTDTPFGGDPSGSSTGNAVAVTSNFAPLAIGTETIGSIVSPSAYASIVGMHPTVGLVSADNIIPLSPVWDSAGPMGKTVSDIAMTMTVFASNLDEADARSSAASPVAGIDFIAALDPNALQGARIGLVGPDPSMSDEEVIAGFSTNGVLDALEAAGAEVVVVQQSGIEEPDWWQIITCGLRDGVNAYLSENQLQDPATLADIIAINRSNPDIFMPLGQSRLEEAEACTLTAAEEAEMAAAATEVAQTYIDDLLVSNDVDALVSLDDSWSLYYGLAGYPAITVPRGLIGDWRGGLTFIGASCTDARLVGYAYAFETTGPYRVVPNLVASPEEATPEGDV
ncbi:MAG: amidase family protein [Thermomicrobiales bacterium]